MAIIYGTAGNDTLIGNTENDTIIGGTGNDSLNGGLGNDTYIFNLGDGQDTIFEFASNPVNYGNDTVIFQNISVNDVTFNVTGFIGAENIIASINNTSDNVYLMGQIMTNQQIENFVFSNATLTFNQMTQRLIQNGTIGNDNMMASMFGGTMYGLEGNDTLAGGSTNDTLVGGTGNDSLSGGLSDDTYIFSRGDGQDTIYDYWFTGNPGTNDTVIFKNISVNDVTFSVTSFMVPESITASINNSTDKILLYSQNDTNSRIENYVFSDAVLTYNDVIARFAIYGTEGTDFLIGSNLSEKIYGFGGNDFILARDGNDTLIGGAGNDSLSGENGNDTYIFASGGGQDTINDGLSSYMSTNDTLIFDNVSISNVNFTTNGTDITITINNSTDKVVLYSQNNTNLRIENFVFSDAVLTYNQMTEKLAINGTSGNDSLNGTNNFDTIYGFDGNDTINAIDGNDIVYGGNGNDFINGGSSSDIMYGDAGNDTLMGGGGAGADTMYGGTGDDIYYVDNLTNVVIENSNEGNDTVFVGNSYTLGANLENLTLAGFSSINGTGNSLDNMIMGNSFNNIISGQGGNDTIIAEDGNDTIIAGDGNDFLGGWIGDDTYIFARGDGQDTINDTYYMNLSAGGNDTLIFQNISVNDVNFSYLKNYSDVNIKELVYICLKDTNDIVALVNQTYNVSKIENFVFSDTTLTYNDILTRFTLTGSEMPDILFGLDFSEKIYGLGGNDMINARAGNDTIDGGTGADNMSGGTDNDTYYVDNIGDVITENIGEGTDTVISSIDYTLGANTENLILTATTAINATGNSLDNYIIGNSLNNIIDGSTGSDTLAGRLGNDTYYIDNAGNVIIENIDEGSDTVNSSVSYTLSANVENLTLTGTSDINGNGNDLNNLITGNSGNNILDGTTGTDTLIGELGNDTYVIDNTGDIVTENTGEGTDTVNSSIDYLLGANLENLTLEETAISGIGNDLNNIITGNSGNNIIDGGIGTDTMIGCIGNDTYYIDNTGDVITENSSEGIDKVISSFTYTLGNNLENLTLIGTDTINGTGNTLDNYIIGNSAANKLTGGSGNDTLDGSEGIDTMIGGTGDDSYYIEATSERITENTNEGTDTVYSSITYTLGSNLENLTLLGTSAINATGNTLNNILIGNSGNNSISGGTGADTMIGGAGNDSYTVDNAGDVVIENADDGTDLVTSSVTYTLVANIEKLTLSGSSAINGTGNELDNTLIGNSGANILTGGAGNDTLNGGSGTDTMIGGLGNDTYTVDNTGDIVTENTDEGVDKVNSSITYTLTANVENLTLTGSSAISGTGNDLDNYIIGNTGANTIIGRLGNDTIDGGSGNDSMIGGADNDTYFVNAVGDVITENVGEGTDTVNSSATFTLSANIENLTLTGTSAINGTGNALDNYIVGNTGNNSIDGATGADTMIGSAGNDTYTIDNAGDVIIENLNEGTDTVNSNIDYTLCANLEKLILTGTAIYATGNDLNNTITGNAADNIIDGGLGADSMIGGTGNDTYYIDNTGDRITEASSTGTDTVISSITYTLGSNLENLTLIGEDDINATGNSLANYIIGNSANNALTGAAGNDTIVGNAGNDSITDTSGNDTYLFKLGDNLDTITDSAGTDIISLGSAVNKNSIAFYKDSTKFYIDYGDSVGVDKITVNSWNTTANQIEKVQLNDGTYLTNIEINTIIQNMTAYATANNISLTSVEDVKNNAELMSMYMNTAWHS